MLKNNLKMKFLASILLATTLLSGCVSDVTGVVAKTFFQSPIVSVTSIMPKNMSNGQLAFDFGLKVHNPNSIPLPINTISSEIVLNGLTLLSASGVSQQAIPAVGDGQVTLSANIGEQQINQLLTTISSPNLDYDLKGQVGVMGKNMMLPIQKKGSINVVNLAAKLIQARLSK